MHKKLYIKTVNQHVDTPHTIIIHIKKKIRGATVQEEPRPVR